MRNRKGWSILIPFILIGIMALTGCSEEEASGGVTDVTDALFLSENVDEVDSSGEGADQESVSGIQGAEAEAGARIMTAEECSEMEQFLNETGNYGFLLSVYERPQDLDAEQVFYIGAGIELIRVTDEEREAYLDETGREEAVNLFKLSTSQISDFLLHKTGISFDQLTKRPDWVYLEEYDSYYQCHGDEDTNICTFEVTDGAVQGDYCRVHYRLKRFAGDMDGWHLPVYEVILKKNGDSYRFCANRFWMEKELLVRTYMKTDLTPGGSTSICAYKPEKGISENADVTFALVRDGDIAYTLPGMTDSNIRKDTIFNNIRAVDCGDYDGDGKTEILTICRYQLGRRAFGRGDSLEARIYRLSNDGSPVLDKPLTSRINRHLKTLSISEIETYIKSGNKRVKYSDWKEAYAAEVSARDPKDFKGFALIYIDDNRTPELLEMGSTDDKGARVFTFHNGVLEETKISRDFAYLRKGNLVLSKNGTGNYFSETLFIITGNRLGIFQNGNYGTMDAAVTSYDKDGKPNYTYLWDDTPVTEAGYRDALGFLFDTSRAVEADQIKLMSAGEILRELK